MDENVERYRRAHDAFNRRDWEGVIADFAANAEYTDQARGVTVKSAHEFVDYLRSGWVAAFPDAAVTQATYLDAGDHVIAQFTGVGTQDGALGPMPASGNRMAMPMCEVMHFDGSGRIVRGELYYDQVTMLVQLGHMPAPA